MAGMIPEINNSVFDVANLLIHSIFLLTINIPKLPNAKNIPNKIIGTSAAWN